MYFVLLKIPHSLWLYTKPPKLFTIQEKLCWKYDQISIYTSITIMTGNQHWETLPIKFKQFWKEGTESWQSKCWAWWPCIHKTLHGWWRLASIYCEKHSSIVLSCLSIVPQTPFKKLLLALEAGVWEVYVNCFAPKFCFDSSLEWLVIYNEGLHACIIKPLHLWSWKQNKDSHIRARSRGP